MMKKKINIQTEKKGINRRDFATRSILGIAGITIGSNISAQTSSENLKELTPSTVINSEKRKLGSLEVSPIKLTYPNLVYYPSKKIKNLSAICPGKRKSH